MAITTTVPAITDIPNRLADDPATFSTKALSALTQQAAQSTALNSFATEANSLASEVNGYRTDLDPILVNMAEILLADDNAAAASASAVLAATYGSGRVIASVADFALLTDLTNGQAIFIADSNHGGPFVYDTSILKTAHNGGTFFDPDVDMTTWTYTSANAGFGVLRRLYSGSVNVRWFGGLSDGTLSDVALQECVTAFSGQRIYMDDGEHNYSKYPTGLDSVILRGSSKIIWTDVQMPIFAGVYTGGKETAIVAGVIRYYLSTEYLGSGYIDGETVNIISPSGGAGGTATVTVLGSQNGVDTATLVFGGSGYVDGSKALLTSSTGGGCQVDIVASGGAITGITKRSAWYFLKDGGEEHDPVLLGHVTDSGVSSLTLSVTIGELGLDATKWTPSGFVVGADEGLANSGVTFGGSVGTDHVTIYGSYNAQDTGYIYYDGASWQFSGHAYDNPSYSNGVLTLTRPIAATKEVADYGPQISPIMRRNSAADWGANIVNVGMYGTSSTGMSLVFTDINGDRVLTPDTRLKFWMSDSKLKNPPFNFGGEASPSSNIWMIGTFTRRV